MSFSHVVHHLECLRHDRGKSHSKLEHDLPVDGVIGNETFHIRKVRSLLSISGLLHRLWCYDSVNCINGLMRALYKISLNIIRTVKVIFAIYEPVNVSSGHN